MSYRAETIANCFLRIAALTNSSISPMKMQKLIYLAHAYCLVYQGKPLVNELFEAWKFGPVLPSIYHAFKWHISQKIDRQIPHFDATVEDPKIREILEFIWENYGKFRAEKLSKWTHERDGPWDRVVNGSQEHFRNQTIPNEFITKYFEKLLGLAT